MWYGGSTCGLGKTRFLTAQKVAQFKFLVCYSKYILEKVVLGIRLCLSYLLLSWIDLLSRLKNYIPKDVPVLFSLVQFQG